MACHPAPVPVPSSLKPSGVCPHLVCKLALPKPTKPHPKHPCALSCTQRVNQSQRKPRTAAKVLDPLLLTAGKYKMLMGRRAGAVLL